MTPPVTFESRGRPWRHIHLLQTFHRHFSKHFKTDQAQQVDIGRRTWNLLVGPSGVLSVLSNSFPRRRPTAETILAGHLSSVDPTLTDRQTTELDGPLLKRHFTERFVSALGRPSHLPDRNFQRQCSVPFPFLLAPSTHRSNSTPQPCPALSEHVRETVSEHP